MQVLYEHSPATIHGGHNGHGKDLISPYLAFAALKPYSNEKGNLRFNLDEPLPTALLVRIAKALAAQAEP